MMIARVLWVVLFLGVAPLHASAECAWVLWLHGKEVIGDRTTTSQWEVIQAVQSEPLCMMALQGKMKLERPENVVSNNTVRIKGSQSTMTFRYLCLPDTMDPRGPKVN
jgi:hypothetical protein